MGTETLMTVIMTSPSRGVYSDSVNVVAYCTYLAVIIGGIDRLQGLPTDGPIATSDTRQSLIAPIIYAIIYYIYIR